MTTPSEKFLAIDIGGSHIKATILDNQGNLLIEYKRVETPRPATPEKVLEVIKNLVKDFPAYDKVSAGFPGYIKEGVVHTAPNLDPEHWQHIPFAELLSKQTGKPARVINDADMLGLGVISGKGFEMMIALGTGFGTALFNNGILLPHLELAHLPITKKETYDDYVGEKALEKIGSKKWNKRIEKVITLFKTVFNYDTLYMGGGNSAKLKLKLGADVKIVSNEEGIHGGARLWEQ